MDIPFLKDIARGAKLSFKGGGERYVGIDIGLSSVKVVQLRKEEERAILETYGQLRSDTYLKTIDSSSMLGGFLRYADEDIAAMLRDALRESNVTTKSAVMSVPAYASFITLAEMPKIAPPEWATVLPIESRRYIPVPHTEVFTNWVVIEGSEESNRMKVLFVAVPRDVISKYERITHQMGLELAAIEVESFGIVRSLLGADPAPTLVLYFGFESTTAIIIDEGIIRLNHAIDRGQEFLTNAIARGMTISKERAEDLKNEIGLSDRIEQQEIAGILEPLIESFLREIERVMNAYNRENERKIEKTILSGGGARMKGLVNFIARMFGIEVSIGNAFKRITYPQFMQPILRDVSPHFAVAVGLALRELDRQ